MYENVIEKTNLKMLNFTWTDLVPESPRINLQMDRSPASIFLAEIIF